MTDEIPRLCKCITHKDPELAAMADALTTEATGVLYNMGYCGNFVVFALITAAFNVMERSRTAKGEIVKFHDFQTFVDMALDNIKAGAPVQ